MTNNSVFNVPMEFIENSLKLSLECARGEREYLPTDTDLRAIYFFGRNLALDTKDEFCDTEVIVLNFEAETFNLFSGGMRRLLSIRALKYLEELMILCKKTHSPKVWSPRYKQEKVTQG